jgi:endonuclease/exonuclease/phosphatase family metal-dependent hydrolase
MRIASFNVENMFDRAKALNGADWTEGKAALEAHKELNRLFEQQTYSDATKERILTLLKAQGMMKQDEGPLMILRKIRGHLIKRARTAPPEIVASGRDDWVGWVELKTEPVDEQASQNTARVIAAVNADVLGVIEAEDRITLKRFNELLLPEVGAAPYEHVMLVDGNDDRGIDVGCLTRFNFPIKSIRSHVDDKDTVGVIFSRDCAEYEIHLPSGNVLWLLVNHLKSKGYGDQASNDAKRKRQAERVRELYEEHLAAGDELVAIIGDFNEVPDGDPLRPLLSDGSTLRDVAAHPKYDNGGRPGTHGNCGADAKLDYILLSPALYDRVTVAGVERRGMWGGKNGTLWPHFPEVRNADEAASDHAAVWAEIDIN